MNQRQFERAVYRYQDRVYGFAYYFLGDREEAADVTQEVLLRLWMHRHEVDPERLLSWLLRVARNVCIDALRKRKASRLVQADADGLARAEGDEPSPAASAQATDFQQHLERALARIAEPYRSIVMLREIQDLKYEEISGAMDLPLNTVKVYLHRARKMLRTQLMEVTQRELV